MMDIRNINVLVRKEVRESLKNRWFILYTAGFSILALLVMLFATSSGDIGGYSGFGRITASLINLVLFFIPLISIVTGAVSISGERENKTLAFLLSHPVSKSEVFIGKFTGLLISIWVSIVLGFGLAGVVAALRGGSEDASRYLMMALLSALLAASILSVGFLVSSLSRKVASAMGVAVFLWLAFIVLGDLGIMGTTIAMDLGVRQVFVLAVINPVEVFKMTAVMTLSPRFEVLGPVGIYALRTFGSAGTFWLLSGVMVLWTAVPLCIAMLSFTVWRREE